MLEYYAGKLHGCLAVQKCLAKDQAQHSPFLFLGANTNLTLSRHVGNILPHTHFAPLPKSQNVFKTPWSVNFLLHDFPSRKLQFHQSDLMYVAMATMQLFSKISKTRISVVFQVFPPERNFLWLTFHTYDLIS